MPNLSTESIEGATLPLESVDHIHGGDGLPLGVLGVSNRVPDNVLKEDLQHSASLLVDESGDSLDPSSAGQPPDGGFGDALDVITQDLPVPLGASFA